MEWKKTWQIGGGTAEFSVSIDPNGLRKKKEEKFEDWEVITTPPYEEMKRFDGTAPPLNKHTNEHEDTSREPASATPPLAERRGQETPSMMKSTAMQTSSDGETDLRPCDRCNGYHYIDSCAYHLSEEGWLQYHDAHMPTHSNRPQRSLQPGGLIVNKTQSRMTDSSKKMLAEDIEYSKKRMLENGRAPPADLATLAQKEQNESKDEGSEDELGISPVAIQQG